MSPAEPKGAKASGKPKIDRLASAYAAVDAVVRDHRENFARFSWLLPKDTRQDLFTLYAYCRTADDASDDPGTPAERLNALSIIEQHLLNAVSGGDGVSFYPAVAEMIHRRQLPQEEFLNLLNAFRWDQTHTDWESLAELEAYCRWSANPVGRLVLGIFYSHDFAVKHYNAADKICTGLQLVNFWQDVKRDFDSGRIYLPRDLRDKHGVDNATLQRSNASDGYKALLKELCDITETVFNDGRAGLASLRGITGFTINSQTLDIVVGFSKWSAKVCIIL